MPHEQSSDHEGPDVVLLLSPSHPQSGRLQAALSPLGLRIEHVPPELSGSRADALDDAAVLVFALARDGRALRFAARLRRELRETPTILFVADGPLEPSQVERAYALGATDIIHDQSGDSPIRARVGSIVHSARRARQRASGIRRAARPSAHAVRQPAAHELRKTLGALRLTLRALEQPVSRAEALTGIRRCLRQVDRMARLTDSLIDAGLAEGPSNRTFAEVDVAKVVAELAEDLRPEVQLGGAQLHLESQPVRALLDRTRLEQIVTNLLLNAARHANSSTIRVFVTGASDAIRIEVRDDGVGIDLTDGARGFEQRSKNSGAGPGLGLWITRSLVEACGGTIAIESKVAAGTSFIVHLPIGRSA
jgi:signal transduction histidine kinase